MDIPIGMIKSSSLVYNITRGNSGIKVRSTIHILRSEGSKSINKSIHGRKM